MRKLNATLIEDKNLADALQGRKPDSISEAYFKQNPKRLREKYLDHLDKLTVYDTRVTVIRSDEVKELERQNNMLQVETEKLKVDNKKYRREIDYINDKLDNLELD